MNVDMRVLTVLSYGEKPEDDMSVTFNPNAVKMVAAQDSIIQERPVKVVTVFFLDDMEPFSIYVSSVDLLSIETAVGSYGFAQE